MKCSATDITNMPENLLRPTLPLHDIFAFVKGKYFCFRKRENTSLGRFHLQLPSLLKGLTYPHPEEHKVWQAGGSVRKRWARSRCQAFPVSRKQNSREFPVSRKQKFPVWTRRNSAFLTPPTGSPRARPTHQNCLLVDLSPPSPPRCTGPSSFDVANLH